MAIKPPGTGPLTGAAGASGAEQTGALGAGFESILKTTGPSLAESPQVIDRAAEDIARQVDSGSVASGVEATDAFIARLVELQAGPGADPSAIAARTDELQLMLGDDPVFVDKVATLLAGARSAS